MDILNEETLREDKKNRRISDIDVPYFLSSQDEVASSIRCSKCIHAGVCKNKSALISLSSQLSRECANTNNKFSVSVDCKDFQKRRKWFQFI